MLSQRKHARVFRDQIIFIFPAQNARGRNDRGLLLQTIHIRVSFGYN